MFKKTMTFEDLDGNEVTDTFYFNFNKKELAEMIEFGNLEEKMEKLSMPVEKSGLTQQENTKMAYDIFQDWILDSYGQKSADNLSFDKNETIRNYWRGHVAFVELIWEMIENPKLATEFIEACMPPKMVAAAKEEMKTKHEGLESTSLLDMVAEAERRQKDPATRIEPGPEAAREALGSNPEVEKAAVAVKEAQEAPKPKSEMTAEDVRALSDEDFANLDVKGLSQAALVAAFQRKSS
jgi:hypothetical protein